MEKNVTKYTNNNKLNGFDEILRNFVSTHNKKFDLYFISCELVIEFDNNFIKDPNISYVHNKEINKITQCLLYCIDVFESKSYKVFNINQMTIKTINDICSITYENYMNNPMSMVERRTKNNIAKNPQLISLFDRNKNHPLVRKYSYIRFDNK